MRMQFLPALKSEVRLAAVVVSSAAPISPSLGLRKQIAAMYQEPLSA